MRVGAHLIEAPRGTSVDAQGPPGSISDPTFLTGYARCAEAVGFDSLWLSEHVANPVHYASPYPFAAETEALVLGSDAAGTAAEQRFPFDTTAFPDPLVVLGWVAAVTTRLALCTSVMILPVRNPVVLAKQAATLDALSGGRLELGVGLGWWREEVEAVAGEEAWRRRARLADESIEAMRRLWTEDEASFDGELIAFPPLRCDPKPARQAGVRLLLGGASAAGARRAGRFADGFIPHPPGPGSDALAATMREAAREAGRDPDAIELIGMVPDGDADRIEELEQAGFSHVYVMVNGHSLEAAEAALESTAERLGLRPDRSVQAKTPATGGGQDE